ncbi:UNVERIFIED_CONTAM: hypothetical protein FKN15_037937 [Acipenser sinensis]
MPPPPLKAPKSWSGSWARNRGINGPTGDNVASGNADSATAGSSSWGNPGSDNAAIGMMLSARDTPAVALALHTPAVVGTLAALRRTECQWASSDRRTKPIASLLPEAAEQMLETYQTLEPCRCPLE